MLIGFFAFMSINEPIKENLSIKEKNFGVFILNAKSLLLLDKRLQRQIIVIFLSFSYFYLCHLLYSMLIVVFLLLAGC